MKNTIEYIYSYWGLFLVMLMSVYLLGQGYFWSLLTLVSAYLLLRFKFYRVDKVYCRIYEVD